MGLPGIGIMFGNLVASPYTVADEENTSFLTLFSVMALRRLIAPPTFTRQYSRGIFDDSPTALSEAKCITDLIGYFLKRALRLSKSVISIFSKRILRPHICSILLIASWFELWKLSITRGSSPCSTSSIT